MQNNNIVVDDSLQKYMLNPSENVLLPKIWTFAGASHVDTYLMDLQLHWIPQLHMDQNKVFEHFGF